MRLNGWQRLGVIASIVWAVIGGFLGDDIGIHAGDWASRALLACLEMGAQSDAVCDATFRHDFTAAVANHWYYAAFLGLGPIPVAWVIAYGLIGIWRWVVSGFKVRA